MGYVCAVRGFHSPWIFISSTQRTFALPTCYIEIEIRTTEENQYIVLFSARKMSRTNQGKSGQHGKSEHVLSLLWIPLIAQMHSSVVWVLTSFTTDNGISLSKLVLLQMGTPNSHIFFFLWWGLELTFTRGLMF